MRKFALVDLKGGFGNQIFILCFAYYLKSQNFRVGLDTNFFKNNQLFPRELEVDLSKSNLNIFNFRNNRLFFYLNTWFEEIPNFKSTEFKLFNRFTGYYQNLQYLEYSKDKIISITGVRPSPKIKNSCMIHLRKGDYVQLKEDLDLNYYEAAIDSILSKYKNINFDIYTDDPDFVPNRNIFRNLKNIYYPTKDSNSATVLNSMMKYQHYIIANSSFSLIAAYLGADDSSEVYYPDPWWKHMDVFIQNIPKNWNKIENSS